MFIFITTLNRARKMPQKKLLKIKQLVSQAQLKKMCQVPDFVQIDIFCHSGYLKGRIRRNTKINRLLLENHSRFRNKAE